MAGTCPSVENWAEEGEVGDLPPALQSLISEEFLPVFGLSTPQSCALTS